MACIVGKISKKFEGVCLLLAGVSSVNLFYPGDTDLICVFLRLQPGPNLPAGWGGENLSSIFLALLDVI